MAKGRRPGIYLNDDDYQRQISGFPGAIGKSFSTREAAEWFVRAKSATLQNVQVFHERIRAPLRETTPINLAHSIPNASVWYYAVAIGREPGVYGSWPEC